LVPQTLWAESQVEAPPGRTAAELRTEYRVLSTRFAAAGGDTRPEEPGSGSVVFVAPDQYTEAVASALSRERREYADALFKLAQRAAQAGELSLAFQWATESVWADPDHADARRVLGYERHGDQWLTAHAARMVEAGKVWKPKSGWIAASDVGKVQKPSRDGWQIRTDNFLVTSNHSFEAAAELGGRLERLHQVWRQLFAGFCFSEREVQQLFAGERQARSRNRPFRVFYHRDKDDYVAALRRRQPRISETLGIYFDRDREAHFFAGPEARVGTLHHEAVHQLFQETRPAARRVGGDANFWIVEGVAAYFETLTEHRDPAGGLYYTIGEASRGRLPAARRRMLVDGYYVPLGELVRLGKDPMQRYPDLAKLYGQSTGLAAFLMGGGEGRYREPLVRYLSAVYAGRDDVSTLSMVTGRSDAELDAEYRAFLESLP
jgi:hypothetical protein